MLVKLQNVRLAFPDLFKPDDKYNKYGAVFIIDPKHRQVKEIEEAIEAVAKEKWGAKADAVLAKLRKDGDICYSRDEYEDKNGEPYAGFEGMFWIRGGNSAQPTIVDVNRAPLTERSGKPYPGCYVNAHLDIWPQDNDFGRRINASLSGVQFLRDGDAFTGGRPSSVDEFEDMSDGADAELPDDDEV